MHLTTEDILARDTNFRRNFMNTLPGPRGVHLIGTKGYRGTENLGVFNSVVHLGASPPLLGFHLRPLTVARHTYHHIKANRCYTLNTLNPQILNEGHQTSANYPMEVSEFDAVGLTPEYSSLCEAPYVKESTIKIGLVFEEEHHISSNDTVFIVGRVIEVFVPDNVVESDGHVDHQLLQTLSVAGLDTYYRPGGYERLAYARPK